jgi:hypothetical protein
VNPFPGLSNTDIHYTGSFNQRKEGITDPIHGTQEETTKKKISKKIAMMECHMPKFCEPFQTMEGILPEDLLEYGMDPSETLECDFTLNAHIPWDNWPDTDTQTVMSPSYIQTDIGTSHMDTQTVMPSSYMDNRETIKEDNAIFNKSDTCDTDTSNMNGYAAIIDKSDTCDTDTSNMNGYAAIIDKSGTCDTDTSNMNGYAAIFNKSETCDTPTTDLDKFREPVQNFRVVTSAPIAPCHNQGDEPTQTGEKKQRLTRRGLPMRGSAMLVAARVASIVSWENANEESSMVRNVANIIDNEITREVSRKRGRTSTQPQAQPAQPQSEPITFDDSECDDGADGDSEMEQCSEPDEDDLDADFVEDAGEDEICSSSDEEEEEEEFEDEDDDDEEFVDEEVEDDEIDDEIDETDEEEEDDEADIVESEPGVDGNIVSTPLDTDK